MKIDISTMGILSKAVAWVWDPLVLDNVQILHLYWNCFVWWWLQRTFNDDNCSDHTTCVLFFLPPFQCILLDRCSRLLLHLHVTNWCIGWVKHSIWPNFLEQKKKNICFGLFWLLHPHNWIYNNQKGKSVMYVSQ